MELFALNNVVNPFDEAIAYEVLWALQGMTEKKLAQHFKGGFKLPTDVLRQIKGIIPHQEIIELEKDVKSYLLKKAGTFSVCVHGDFQYPEDLRQANYPIELFYYRGNLDLLSTKSLSIVGARKASQAGLSRAARLAKELSEEGYTIVSGLATGVDTAAQTSTIDSRGQTIGVIGTPLDKTYPKENTRLQEKIASEHLLISQVPFYRYANESFMNHKHYFPRRNVTMASISLGTIIVEASDTSGSLTQARACIQQNKKLFILDSCFHNKDIKWPAHYETLGAIRVKNTEDILARL